MRFHSFLIAWSISILVAFPGSGVLIFCTVLFLFSAPFLAASSAASFPSVPIWALTQAIVHFLVSQDMFSYASAVFSAILDLSSMLFRARTYAD